MSEDLVKNPGHYTSHPSGVECIQITRHMDFLLGNALKYIWRADLKHDDGGLQDLRKAQQYLTWAIEKREEESAPEAEEAPATAASEAVKAALKPIGEAFAQFREAFSGPWKLYTVKDDHDLGGTLWQVGPDGRTWYLREDAGHSGKSAPSREILENRCHFKEVGSQPVPFFLPSDPEFPAHWLTAAEARWMTLAQARRFYAGLSDAARLEHLEKAIEDGKFVTLSGHTDHGRVWQVSADEVLTWSCEDGAIPKRVSRSVLSENPEKALRDLANRLVVRSVGRTPWGRMP